jgi:hypothetical protein
LIRLLRLLGMGVPALLGVLLGAPSCFDAETLVGLRCISDDDCWRTQRCVRTATQRMRNAQGECQEGGCGIGTQHGCACAETSASTTTCDSVFIPSSPTVGQCICCDAMETTVAFEGELACAAPEDGSTGDTGG